MGLCLNIWVQPQSLREIKALKKANDKSIIKISDEDTVNISISGAIPRNDRNRMDKHAELYYAEIRKRDGDIAAISKNTGFSVDDIRKIKAHIFNNRYDLGGVKAECFDADYDMAVSWQRLIEGKNIKKMDIVLLNHELLEQSLMNEKMMSYTEAHREAEKSYSYIKYVKNLNQKEGIR